MMFNAVVCADHLFVLQGERSIRSRIFLSLVDPCTCFDRLRSCDCIHHIVGDIAVTESLVAGASSTPFACNLCYFHFVATCGKIKLSSITFGYAFAHFLCGSCAPRVVRAGRLLRAAVQALRVVHTVQCHCEFCALRCALSHVSPVRL